MQAARHPSHFWIPHILYFTGARLQEIGQLLVDDIKCEGGIWYFDLNEEGLVGKSLKNQSSKRLIPMHPKLIEAGLLDHVEAVRSKGHVKLWPNLKRTINGYGSAVSKWFINHRLRRKGITQGKKDCHSFRHTLTTKLYDADCSDSVVDQLTGHAGSGESATRYDKGRSIIKLDEAVQSASLIIPASLSKSREP